MKQEKKNGKKEGAKESSVQIAKELLKIGMEVKQIIEATNLSKKEIEELKKE